MIRIDPFITAAQRRLESFSRPQPKDPAARRAQAKELGALAFAELGITAPVVATEEHTLVVPGHPDARLRVYWPTGERAAPDARLPIFVHFFGGGFTIGSIDDPGWDAAARRRASEAGIIVVAGEYSHAPEVRFPAQPEQCWTVFEWAVANALSIGGDPARIAIGGASSGANLAAAVTLLNRERSAHPIRVQVLEAPALDLTMRSVETRGLRTGVPDAILRKLGLSLVRQYLGPDRALRTHPIASPLRASDHAGLPPAVIYTAELDPLRGDGEAYGRALLRAGVPTTVMRYLAQTHTSGGLLGWVPSADHLHRDIVTVLRSLHDDPAEYASPIG